MVDYTDFEEARLREKKGKCFPITSPGHHREKKFFFREIKNETVFKFLLKYATMKFLRTFFISFCSFWSCVLRETSMVDYTDFEEERLREKRKMFQINITSSAHHREKKFFFREILKIFF